MRVTVAENNRTQKTIACSMTKYSLWCIQSLNPSVSFAKRDFFGQRQGKPDDEYEQRADGEILP